MEVISVFASTVPVLSNGNTAVATAPMHPTRVVIQLVFIALSLISTGQANAKICPHEIRLPVRLSSSSLRASRVDNG